MFSILPIGNYFNATATTSGRTMALGRLSLRQKRDPGTFPGGKDGQCIGLTTLPPSCADCLEIWEPQPSGSFRDPRPVVGLLYLCY